MSDNVNCPDCGAEVPAGLPKGLCSLCALQGVLELKSNEMSLTDMTRTPVSATLPPSFGDYELLEELGRGGMGVVYKARQRSLNRLVAVKMLLFGPHAGAELIRRFRVEAVASGALNHPNIIAIHEVGLHEGQPFLVMDYVDSENLAKLARGRPLPARRAAGYVKTIAEAIHYAHEKGILHRDLKPSNVLIDASDRPWVMDFGLAKRLTDAPASSEFSGITATGELIGSPCYMPPEQASGKRGAVGRRSDVYSIGAMLYQLLTGRPPFVGVSLSDVLHQVQDEEPIAVRLLNPAVPRDLETVCLKCLEKDPQRRYATAQELADDLGRWSRLEPIRARPIGPVARLARWIHRNPAGAGLMLALVLGLAIALGLLELVNEHRRNEQEAIGVLRTRLTRSVDELWTRDDKPSELISSEEMAALAGKNKVAPGPNGVRLVVLLGSSRGPLERARAYQPLFDFIETQMTRRLHRPVRLDLELYKPSRSNIKSLVEGKTHLARLGAVSFARARELDPGILPIAQEMVAKETAVFARRQLGITNLSQLRGHSFAFGDKDATLSAWAKALLLRAGIRATNLSRFALLDSAETVRQEMKADKNRALAGDMNSHRDVIKAVLDGRFDAGVARLPRIAGFADRELIVLQTFGVTPNVWAARSGLSSEVCEALKAALLLVPKPLARAAPNATDGFRAVDPAMVAELSQILADAERFERAASPARPLEAGEE